MPGRRVLAGVLLVAAAAGAAALLVVAPWEDGGGAKPLSRPDLQRALDRLVAQKNVAPGAVAAVITPKGTWIGAAGTADLAKRTPASPDDHFRIASLTKTYTATLVLTLVSEGKLGLGDTVARRLPGVLPADKATITIRQLLSHSSGLYDSINDAVNALNSEPEAFYASLHDPAYVARLRRMVAAISRDPATRISPRVWVDVAARRPLYFPPGEGSHYSTTNYVLLGWIVEKATHERLGEAMKRRLFEPLGLEHTVYEPGPALPAPFMRGYVLPTGGKPAETTRVTLGIAGGSAIVATAEDVARFYAALLAGRLLPQKVLDETMLPERMGIGSYPAACGAAYGHGGAWGGYLSWAEATSDGRAAVLFLNGNGERSNELGGSAAIDLLCAA